MKTVKVIELIGTSTRNWEDAANNAVKEAQETIKGITGLEVVGQTAKVENGAIAEYRTNVKVAFSGHRQALKRLPNSLLVGLLGVLWK